MNYLSPSEYETYGLEATTPLRCSRIDRHRCATAGGDAGRGAIRRTAPNRCRAEHRTCDLRALAVIAPATTPIVLSSWSLCHTRRGEWPFDDISSDIALMFGLPGTWNAVDPAGIDVYADTGELTLPVNAVGLGYSEIDLAYTAGLAVIPDRVKGWRAPRLSAMRNPRPALNVRSGRIDRMHLDYFADTLVDQTVRSLLAPYVAQKVG